MADDAAKEFYSWCDFYRQTALQDTSEKPGYLIDSEIRTYVILLRPILEKLSTRLIAKKIDPTKCVSLIGELNVIAIRPVEYLMGSLEPKLDDVWSLAKQLELSAANPKEDLRELILDALRSKPALSTLFDRLSFARWESVNDQDSKNLQRLIELLLPHGFELERPRGEKKVRLKTISDNAVR
jgi:hypothetical protein